MSRGQTFAPWQFLLFIAMVAFVVAPSWTTLPAVATWTAATPPPAILRAVHPPAQHLKQLSTSTIGRFGKEALLLPNGSDNFPFKAAHIPDPSAHAGKLLGRHFAFGFFASLCVTVAAYFVRKQRKLQMPPLLMVSFAAKRQMVPPTAALNFWMNEDYALLDIRSEMERRKGRIQSSKKHTLAVPLLFAKAFRDPVTGTETLKQEVNMDWLNEVEAKIPKSAKVIVMCSDGGSRTSQAVDLLAGRGYRDVVGMTGGFNKWNQLFTQNQQFRPKESIHQQTQPLQDIVTWRNWDGNLTTLHDSLDSVLNATLGDQALASHLISTTLQVSNVSITVELAHKLFKNEDYDILDIRSEMEGSEGRVCSPTKNTVDVPMFHATAFYDSFLGNKVVRQRANKEWLKAVKECLTPDAKIILMCSDGTSRSAQALHLLLEEGYRNVVVMRGGYNKWDQIYNERFYIRSAQEQATKAEWLQDPVEWQSWVECIAEDASSSAGMSAAEGKGGRGVATAKRTRSGKNISTVKFATTVEDAFKLWQFDEYDILDIRSEMEGEERRLHSPTKGTINIPLFHASSGYDSVLGNKVVRQKANRQWLTTVKERLPRDSKVIIMCSDGTSRSAQALVLMTMEGYVNTLVMRGGYNKWDQVFDENLEVRDAQMQAIKSVWLQDPVEWLPWLEFAAEDENLPSDLKAAAEGKVSHAITRMDAPTSHPDYVLAEEAIALWMVDDYIIVDIRSEMEREDGVIEAPCGCIVHVPMFDASSRYDSLLGQYLVEQKANLDWLKQFEDCFSANAKIIIMCSDGIQRSVQALKLLKADGYTRVAVMEGGYNRWNQLFDKELHLRDARAQRDLQEWLYDPVQWLKWEDCRPVELAAPANMDDFVEAAIFTESVAESTAWVADTTAADSTLKHDTPEVISHKSTIEPTPWATDMAAESAVKVDSPEVIFSKSTAEPVAWTVDTAEEILVTIEDDDVIWSFEDPVGQGEQGYGTMGAEGKDPIDIEVIDVDSTSAPDLWRRMFEKAAEVFQRVYREQRANLPGTLADINQRAEMRMSVFSMIVAVLLAPLWLKSALAVAGGAGVLMMASAAVFYRVGVEPVLVQDDKGRGRVFFTRFGEKVAGLCPGTVLLHQGPTGGLFGGAIVLIVSHNEEGTTGFVINKAIPTEEYDRFGGPVPFRLSANIHRGIGGPVALNEWTILHLVPGVPDAVEICEGLYMGGCSSLLQSAPPGHVKVVHGGMCWGAQQLDGEINAGFWALLEVPATELFAANVATMWGDLYRLEKEKLLLV